MKKLVLLFCLVLGGGGLLAESQIQANINSLIIQLQKAKEDTNKVIILNELGFLYKDFNPEKGITAAKKALYLAEKLNWKKGIAKSNMTIGINFASKYDNFNALSIF